MYILLHEYFGASCYQLSPTKTGLGHLTKGKLKKMMIIHDYSNNIARD